MDERNQALADAACRLSCYMDNNDPDIPYSLACLIYDVELARIECVKDGQAPDSGDANG